MGMVKQMAAFTPEQHGWLTAEAGRLDVTAAEVLRRVVDRVRLGSNDPAPGASPDRTRGDWWQAIMVRRRELGMTLPEMDACLADLTGLRVAPTGYTPAQLSKVYYGMAEWYMAQLPAVPVAV